MDLHNKLASKNKGKMKFYIKVVALEWNMTNVKIAEQN